jgi:hypothetical protein
MRKITAQAVQAFENATPFKNGNTQVEVTPNCTILKLFGNPIAYRYNDPERTLSITNCGWPTDTTRERLNGIEGVSVSQSAGKWYLNGVEWDGNLIDVNVKPI